MWQALGEAYPAAGWLEEAATLWAGVDEADNKLRQLSSGYQALGDKGRAVDTTWLAERVEHEK